MYVWLANLVVAIHGILVITVLTGTLAALIGTLRHHPRLEIAFYTLLAAVIASDILFGECFLTNFEQYLRNTDRPGSAYRGSFIGHYCPLHPTFVQTYIGPILIVSALLAFPFWRWLERRPG